MRHSCSGALGLERLVGLQLVYTRAWTIASLLGVLVSAEAAASSKTERDSLFRERIGLPNGPIAAPEESSRDSSIAAAPAIGSSNLYSEAYWTAVADLDIVKSRQEARTDAESDFARGMEMLKAGNHEQAESTFAALITEVGDLNVAIAARMMLAHTLMYQHKWSELRDLPHPSGVGHADQAATSGLEQWGHAFANTESQSTAFPSTRVSLPMRITAVGSPSIRVKINGKEYEFWLDTGSTMTVLSSDVATAAKVPVISDDTLMVRTFSGQAKVKPALIRKMEVGSIVITNVPAIVIDASMMRLKVSAEGAPWAGYHVDGIIGWDFIRQFNVELDYPGGKLTLSKPEALGLAGTAEQNLTWAGQPLVEVRTKQGKTLHFSLDTGAQSTFLNATVLDALGVVTRAAGGRLVGLAKTSSATDRVIPYLTVTVGGHSMRLEGVIVYGPSYSGLIACDGILGSDLAQYGVVRIDATNGVFSVGA